MTVEKFVEFIVDLANDELYERLDGNAKNYFLHGGCYQFAKIVKEYIPKSQIVINNESEHCGIYYDGNIYDANGIIKDKSKFHIAKCDDIRYMEEKFGIPEKENINGKKISDVLKEELKQCNILNKLELDEEER